MTFSPVSHSVGQRFNVPSAVRGRERLHSSTYNQAGVFLFHDFSKRIGAAMIFACRSICGLDGKPQRAKYLAAVLNCDSRRRQFINAIDVC
jgi:hypothetical protein